MITVEDKKTLNRILSNIDTKEELLDVIESAFDSFYENVNDGSGLMAVVRNKFPDADDVIGKLTVYYDNDDILDVFDDDTKLENIKDSWSLDDYVNEKVEEETSSISKVHEQEIEDLLNAPENKPSYFDLNPDDVYVKMCDFLGVTCYYNHEEIEERMNDMLEKMSHSCYGM